jgi:hypothetical protein
MLPPKPLLDLYRENLTWPKCNFIRFDDSKGTRHLVWMLDEIEKMDDEAKANRWLGFVQGILSASRVFTIDELRDHVRQHMK